MTDIVEMVEYLNSQEAYDNIVEEWEGMGDNFSTNSPLLRLRLMKDGRGMFRHHRGTINHDAEFFSLIPGICIDLDMQTDHMVGVDIVEERITLRQFIKDGIKDVTNLQPHEYGILKLKYGVMKDGMFIPKVFHPLIHEIYKELDL